MSKKHLSIAAAGVAAIVLLAVGLWHQGYIGSGDRRLRRLIKNKPELVTLYDQAHALEEQIKKEPEKVSLYLDLGFRWKSIGDRSGGLPVFYQRSLEAYQGGITRFGSKNIIFYLNAGKIAEILENYGTAEKYYRQAISVSPHDDYGYSYLTELYSYKMNKSKDEIIAVYNEGIKNLGNPAKLIWARGSYLRRIGAYAEALADYQLLVKNFPDNVGYKEIAAELEAKVKEQK